MKTQIHYKNKTLSKKGKGTHGCGQQCGYCWGAGDIRGLTGHENYNKIK